MKSLPAACSHTPNHSSAPWPFYFLTSEKKPNPKNQCRGALVPGRQRQVRKSADAAFYTEKQGSLARALGCLFSGGADDLSSLLLTFCSPRLLITMAQVWEGFSLDSNLALQNGILLVPDKGLACKQRQRRKKEVAAPARGGILAVSKALLLGYGMQWGRSSSRSRSSTALHFKQR